MRLKIVSILMLILFVGAVLVSYPEETPPGMVFVQGGRYWMGSKDRIVVDNEPEHDITLNDFYIGKFEVTQEEWETVMGNNPSLFKGADYPVETVAWYEAVEYCNKRSLKEGLSPCYTGTGDEAACDFKANGYRLPTEAEWEYAAKGGLQSGDYNYSGSNNPDEVAWYELNANDKTQPVGRKKANEIGVYDMSGNVSEWCWDRYNADYYKAAPPGNPAGPPTGDSRICRGGNSCGVSLLLRNTARAGFSPQYKFYDVGFRVVRNDPGKAIAGMVLVEGGKFKMGGKKGKYGEAVVHRVTLDSFYIGKFEVTQEEWKTAMKKNPAFRKGNPAPVNCVNWYDAVAYCNERSRIEGLTPAYSGTGDNITCNFEANGYRLPTEAEWEYACRGGLKSQNYKYSGADEPNEAGWYSKNRIYIYQPVGEKKANELGIYDMSGNVSEWCWDYYDFDYYKNSPQVNPRGPVQGTYRVIRGGSWAEPEEPMLSQARAYYDPNWRVTRLGLRVVRSARPGGFSN